MNPYTKFALLRIVTVEMIEQKNHRLWSTFNINFPAHQPNWQTSDLQLVPGLLALSIEKSGNFYFTRNGIVLCLNKSSLKPL